MRNIQTREEAKTLCRRVVWFLIGTNIRTTPSNWEHAVYASEPMIVCGARIVKNKLQQYVVKVSVQTSIHGLSEITIRKWEDIESA